MIPKSLIILASLASVHAAVLPRENQSPAPVTPDGPSPTDSGNPCGPDGKSMYCGGGICMDIQNDPENCGDCYFQCIPGKKCKGGKCIKLDCDPGWEHCMYFEECRNLQTDNQNCGRCNNMCPSPLTCQNGKCDTPPSGGSGSNVGTPPSGGSGSTVGTPPYGGAGSTVGTPPFTPLSSSGQTGTVGTPIEATPPSGQTGTVGTPIQGTPTKPAPTTPATTIDGPSPTDPGMPCGPDGKWEYCGGGICVDLKNDVNNCGSCVYECRRGQTCEDGVCTPKKCQPGWEHCMFTDDCVDLQNDIKNCGYCDNWCPGNLICTKGKCDLPPGVTEPIQPPPMETDEPPIKTKTLSPKPPTETTKPGDPCGPKGFMQCPKHHGPGFDCINSVNDNNNCGECGNKCRAGENCVDGSCMPPGGCGAQTYCPGSANGPCVNLDNDNVNCGKCGVVCGVGKNCVFGKCK